MSVKSLMGKADFKHTFSDDIESFFYVVLYAGLLWLPHDPVDDLKSDMMRFFGDWRERSGKFSGGLLKLENITQDGTFIRLFNWKNKAFGKWIYGVQEVISAKIADKSVLALRMKKLWERIDGKKLPDDDRYEHNIDDKVPKDEPVSATTSASARRMQQSVSASTRTSIEPPPSSFIFESSGGPRSLKRRTGAAAGQNLTKRQRSEKPPT